MKGLCALLLVLFCSMVEATSKSVLDETLYQHFRHSITTGPNKLLTGLSSFEHSLFVDALWDLTEENDPRVQSVLKNISTFNFDLITQLRIGILRIITGTHNKLPQDLVNQLSQLLLNTKVEPVYIYTLAAHEKVLLKAGHEKMLALARTHQGWSDLTINGVSDNATIMKDLFNHRPESEGVVIYMFCRQDRLYPCLVIMRDRQGEVVKNNDGTLWTHKALGSSKFGLPSHERSGNTPAGVHLIDSVMPVADNPTFYGKFRRVILEFVPRSKDEARLKALLPASSQNASWWMPSVVARDIGRNFLRIHGTGQINPDPKSTYWPFIRTSGCIAQRENTYEGVTYQDQRDLLDTIMLAMDLAPKFENETQIKGVLYLIEINNEARAVSEKDLQEIGVL